MSTPLAFESVDLTSLKPIHEGKWVVMSRETRQVYSFSDKPSFELIEEAKKNGCKDPILQKVMPFDKGFMSHS